MEYYSTIKIASNWYINTSQKYYVEWIKDRQKIIYSMFPNMNF